MQTFLPYRSFSRSAKSLDKQRCWKQVVEADQLITIIECIELGFVYKTTKDKSKKIIGKGKRKHFLTDNVEDALRFKNNNPKYIAWYNHPAIKMWIGSLNTLREYFNVFLKVAKEKHKVKTDYEPKEFDKFDAKHHHPWWFGNKRFHKAMRARLIEKDPKFYTKKFPKAKGFNKGRYLWPDMQIKTFKTI